MPRPDGAADICGARCLVVGQLALSLALLAAAGLFVRGALKAGNIKPGYSFDQGILVELDAGLAGYDEAQGRAVYRHIQETLSALPGVDASSVAATVPFGMVSLRTQRAAGGRCLGGSRGRTQPEPGGRRPVEQCGSRLFPGPGCGYAAGPGIHPCGRNLFGWGARLRLSMPRWPPASGRVPTPWGSASYSAMRQIPKISGTRSGGCRAHVLDSLLEEKQNPHCLRPVRAGVSIEHPLSRPGGGIRPGWGSRIDAGRCGVPFVRSMGACRC